MRLIIAGSRTASQIDTLNAFIDSEIKISEIDQVVCGEANGADHWGKVLAKHFGIEVVSFAANWAEYGTRAGPIRNVDMAKYATNLLLVWDGVSKGSKHMLETAMTYELDVHVYRFGNELFVPFLR